MTVEKKTRFETYTRLTQWKARGFRWKTPSLKIQKMVQICLRGVVKKTYYFDSYALQNSSNTIGIQGRGVKI